VTLGLWNIAAEQTPLKDKDVIHSANPAEPPHPVSAVKIEDKK